MDIIKLIESRKKVITYFEHNDTLKKIQYHLTEYDLKAIKEQLTIPVVVVPKGTLCELDGKKVMVRFKVAKHIPKIVIDDI